MEECLAATQRRLQRGRFEEIACDNLAVDAIQIASIAVGPNQRSYAVASSHQRAQNCRADKARGTGQ
jgi:hypothetical protein